MAIALLGGLFSKKSSSSFKEFKEKRSRSASIAVEYTSSGLSKDPKKIAKKIKKDKGILTLEH